MTRFTITLNEGVNFVIKCLKDMWGGEIFIPKIYSYKLIDLVRALSNNINTKVIGIRPGEKIHEEMITSSDSFTTYDLQNYYVILPIETTWKLSDFISEFNAKKVPEGFHYNSKNNENFLTINDLKDLIKLHVTE